MLAATVAVALAGCGDGSRRPTRLLDGRPAAELAPVSDSVIAAGRIVELDDRADACLAAADRAHTAADSPAVERIGVDGESLTFSKRDGSVVYACDGGIDPAGERAPPWCHTVVGELDHGRLLDARLDLVCVDRAYHPVAYAFVAPTAGARWVGVQQQGYVELYETLAGLPVRVATTRGVDTEHARATLEITQYDARGRPLIHGEMEVAVAG